MNEPRKLPYAFRVVERYEVVWLYDDSERTFICSTNPTIWMEPLYSIDRDCDEIPDADYQSARDIEKLVSFDVPLDEEDVAFDVYKEEAWDSAREEAHGNCLI